jgi:hypothetical protein
VAGCLEFRPAKQIEILSSLEVATFQTTRAEIFDSEEPKRLVSVD